MRKSLIGISILLSIIGAAMWTFFTEGGQLGGAISALAKGSPWDKNAAPAAHKTSPWGAKYFPNVPLVTQEGKQVRFYDDLIKDKKVLINFIYANCEDRCPLATAKLSQVRKLLGSRVGRDIFMYSITLDPENDTPEVLKSYAEKYGAGPGWVFLTGKRKDIDAIRFKLGERGDKEEHPDIVRIGNSAGQWMKIPLEGDLNMIATEIGKTLDPNWYAGKQTKSYDRAPELKAPEQGEILFVNRCAACHTLGKGDRLGPDLLGVTSRRDRAWLGNFIYAPDKMRARKDPIALKLAAKYEKALMPNLGLTKEEVLDLLSFLETRTAAIEGKKAKSAPADPMVVR